MQTGKQAINFPFYVIGTVESNVVVTAIEGVPCIIAYQSQELAELYLEQANDDSLVALPVSSPEEVAAITQSVRDHASDMVWNTMHTPEWIRFVSLSTFL